MNHFWSSFNSEVKSARLALLDSVELDVLDVQNAEWISTRAVFTDGVMYLHHASDEPFAALPLAGVRVVGHMAKPYIQILTETETLLLHLESQESNIRCLATLLAWSETRERGLEAKAWIPQPLFETMQETDKDELLVCKFSVHFTAPHASHSSSWQTVLGSLNRRGLLTLALDKGEPFKLDITQVPADCIRRVDSSLVSSEWVIFIVPDMGGPESVYLKLSTDNDFEDWFVSLRSFCKQTVYTTLSRNPLASVRFNHSFKVCVLSAKVRGSDEYNEFFDFSNTYVDVCFNDWIWARTPVHPTPDDAFWGQEFTFKELDKELAPLELVLRRTNSERPSELDSFLAKVIITDTGDPTERWVALESEEDPDLPLSLYISYQHTRTPVLDASFYEGMRAILRQKTNLRLAYDLVRGESKQIVSACDIFTDIYRGEFMHTEWIASLITLEVQKIAVEANSATTTDVLFRGSSLLSQALEKFMFLHGHEVLSKTIGRFVRKICASKDELELDPSKIHGTQAEVAAVAKVNRLAFEHYMTYLWTLIKNYTLPETFRYLMAHLRKELINQLGVTEAQAWNGLAAFIFLRFYCPALLNPRLFGLVDQTLPTSHQRALTLFAKILQSFANRVKLGSKQEWLLPLNRFLESHDAELVSYYQQISDWNKKIPLPRVPKQLPLKAFMGSHLTNPYLVDLGASYARLASWMASNYEFDKNWDTSLCSLYEECKRLTNKLKEICDNLEQPDPLPEQNDANSNTTLYTNWTSMLYSPDSSLLEAQYVKPPEKKSIFRLFRRS